MINKTLHIKEDNTFQIYCDTDCTLVMDIYMPIQHRALQQPNIELQINEEKKQEKTIDEEQANKIIHELKLDDDVIKDILAKKQPNETFVQCIVRYFQNSNFMEKLQQILILMHILAVPDNNKKEELADIAIHKFQQLFIPKGKGKMVLTIWGSAAKPTYDNVKDYVEYKLAIETTTFFPTNPDRAVVGFIQMQQRPKVAVQYHIFKYENEDTYYYSYDEKGKETVYEDDFTKLLELHPDRLIIVGFYKNMYFRFPDKYDFASIDVRYDDKTYSSNWFDLNEYDDYIPFRFNEECFQMITFYEPKPGNG